MRGRNPERVRRKNGPCSQVPAAIRAVWILACLAAVPALDLAGQPIRATKALEIGLNDQFLTAPIGVVVDPAGGVIILDRSEPFLHFVEAGGRHTSATIKRGAGPGELQSPSRIGVVGDSIWVFDAGQARVSVYNRVGVFLSSRPILPLAMPGTVGSDPIAFTASGRSLFIGALPDESLAAGVVTVPIAGVDPGRPRGRMIATLGLTRAKVQAKVVAGGRPGRGWIDQPFGDDPLWAIAQDGSALILLDRRIPPLGLGARYLVTVLGAYGDTLSRFGVPYRGRPLTPNEYDRVVSELTKTRRLSGGIEVTVEEADLRTRLFRPEFLPPVSAVHAGGDGTIWLRTSFPVFGGDPEYSVFERNGTPVGQLTVPIKGRNRLLGASRQMLWFSAETADGTPTIVSYRVHR